MSGARESVCFGISKPNRLWTGVAVAMAILMAAKAALDGGLFIVNLSPSVPKGVYVRADPSVATYVTFCLSERHREASFFAHFCSQSVPERTKILKRIRHRILNYEFHGIIDEQTMPKNDQGNKTLTDAIVVEGDTPQSIGSSILGPILQPEILGWWVPIATVGPQPNFIDSLLNSPRNLGHSHGFFNQSRMDPFWANADHEDCAWIAGTPSFRSLR